MRERVIGWVCNLAAELELIDSAFDPKGAVAARVDEQARQFLEGANAFAAGLARHLDIRRCENATRLDVVQAWMPTPSARRVLDRSTGRDLSSPGVDVLRRVNHRRFGIALPGSLDGAAFVESLDAFDQHVGSREFPEAGYLLKRPLGFSGRGRKRIESPELALGERRWVEASMTGEYGVGLVVEPFVSIQAEFSLHGFLARGDEPCVYGEPVAQVVDASGAWVRAEPADQKALGPQDSQALYDSGDRVAFALREQGYHGPFSCDAFRYVDAGETRFCSLSEVNARYAMGFFVGFANAIEAWLGAVSSD